MKTASGTSAGMRNAEPAFTQLSPRRMKLASNAAWRRRAEAVGAAALLKPNELAPLSEGPLVPLDETASLNVESPMSSSRKFTAAAERNSVGGGRVPSGKPGAATPESLERELFMMPQFLRGTRQSSPPLV